MNLTEIERIHLNSIWIYILGESFEKEFNPNQSELSRFIPTSVSVSSRINLNQSKWIPGSSRKTFQSFSIRIYSRLVLSDVQFKSFNHNKFNPNKSETNMNPLLNPFQSEHQIWRIRGLFRNSEILFYACIMSSINDFRL